MVKHMDADYSTAMAMIYQHSTPANHPDNDSVELNYYNSSLYNTSPTLFTPRITDRQKKEGGFTCEICGQVIQRQDNFKRHIRLHSGQMPFQCPLCERRFNTRYHLQYHMKCSSAHADLKQ